MVCQFTSGIANDTWHDEYLQKRGASEKHSKLFGTEKHSRLPLVGTTARMQVSRKPTNDTKISTKK